MPPHELRTSGPRSGFRWCFAAYLLLAAGVASAQTKDAAPNPQEAVFAQNCAVCHNNPATRAPGRASLKAMSPAFINEALTNGIMKAQGSALSPAQRVSLAEYLTGQKIGVQAAMAGRCTGTPAPFTLAGPSYNGWGANPENWRYQPEPGIRAADLPKLEVKWAFGFPGAVVAFGQPTVVGNRVFVGSQNGHVYSIDAQTGCYYWDFAASTGVRTAITVARIGDRNVAFFGDRRAHVYALDAGTGETIWKVTAVDAPSVQVTGAPALFEGRLYVPISVGDDSAAIDPKYECCKGRGAVVALDAATGKEIWTTYTLPEARPQGKNSAGTQLWGPSGVSIWATPTIDRKRRMLYVGTGDNHSAPATDTSDAVIAMALDSGAIAWTRQLLAGDMGNGACLAADKTNCPEPRGPDYDLGTSANLVTLPDGKRLLTIGQKSGMMWALDPDDRGRIAWQTRVGKGGLLGGVQWGTATDGKSVYVAVSDIAFFNPVLGQPLVPNPDAGGGLHALAAATGATLWSAPPAKACANRSNCSPAQSGAVTATPEYVLSGSVDGHLRAYSTANGGVLWDYDTAKPFVTANAVAANGGSLDSGGPTVACGMIFVNSGYGLYGGQAGNVLIAFAPRR
ncbi:MAG: PQQ-binding-like beta-propeller repeat protein [Casimicrobiaceae bacterium]